MNRVSVSIKLLYGWLFPRCRTFHFLCVLWLRTTCCDVSTGLALACKPLLSKIRLQLWSLGLGRVTVAWMPRGIEGILPSTEDVHKEKQWKCTRCRLHSVSISQCLSLMYPQLYEQPFLLLLAYITIYACVYIHEKHWYIYNSIWLCIHVTFTVRVFIWW